MKICIVGWYFRPQFLRDIAISGFEAFVIKHRDGDTQGIPSQLYENRGLEFGAYRQYVENHWDGASDVLFIHDDAELSDLSALSDCSRLNEMGVDQAYIFHDDNEEAVNGGVHGRGIWMRGSVIRRLADDFPADMNNTGKNTGVEAHNGILRFHKRLMTLTPNTNVIAIIPTFRFAHRGRLHSEMFVYRSVRGVSHVHQ